MNAVDPVYLRRATEADEVPALRQRVGNAGKRCLGRAERTRSWDAGVLMLRAAQIASVWTWAAATEAQLEDVIVLLTALNVAAGAAERLDASDA
ncbi:hypothetical protein [Sphingomonas agri]|uniref:hypothetical protein n=1 Tax=Sphingomonas agri TaxID=1813878 RepID=UPI00311EFEA6